MANKPKKPKDPPPQDESPVFRRRYIKDEGAGRKLLQDAYRCAENKDDDAFREVLHQLNLYEGMRGFEEGMETYRAFCRALELRGPWK